MPEFFAMNGYGTYIWGAYGAAFLILAALIAVTLIRRARLRKNLDRHDT